MTRFGLWDGLPPLLSAVPLGGLGGRDAQERDEHDVAGLTAESRPPSPWEGPVVAWLVVDGEPQPKQRPRFGGGGRARTPAATRGAEEAIRWQLCVEGVQPVTGRLGVELAFFRERRGRCDLDNLVKLVLDACNGFVWADDSQVVELHARVGTGVERPRTAIRVYRVDGDPEPLGGRPG